MRIKQKSFISFCFLWLITHWTDFLTSALFLPPCELQLERRVCAWFSGKYQPLNQLVPSRKLFQPRTSRCDYKTSHCARRNRLVCHLQLQRQWLNTFHSMHTGDIPFLGLNFQILPFQGGVHKRRLSLWLRPEHYTVFIEAKYPLWCAQIQEEEPYIFKRGNAEDSVPARWMKVAEGW